MPLVAHSKLPTFDRLREEGGSVLRPDQALHQDIRELHIGLLNMMPDAALEATERQFFRLIGESNQIAQFYLHPFTLNELPRGPQSVKHIADHYESFDKLKREGLDALIITGANVTQPDLSNEPFWKPLIEVVEWAYDNVASTVCSCLATHAVMQFRYGKKRQRLDKKRWGVFRHHVVDRRHPLVNDVNTRFDVPHSRFNDVSQQQFEDAGLRVLVTGNISGVHLAVSEDLFRLVMFQGHPEYDTISLLKEYKREVKRFLAGEVDEYPPSPVHYFSKQTQAIFDEYRERAVAASKAKKPILEFPDSIITNGLHNTWHDTAEAVMNNWVGKVYQITNFDRRFQFAEGIDPNNPLGIKDE